MLRLNSEQVETIRRTVHQALGLSCRITLFGSRVNDSARGGDIDLLIDCETPLENRVRREAELAARLCGRLFDTTRAERLADRVNEADGNARP